MLFKSGFAAICALLFAIAPAAAHAEWIEAKSKHFTVYSDGSPKQLTEFSEDLERFDYMLRLMTNVDRDPALDIGAPVRIWLLPDEQAVKSATGNPNIGGVYFASARSGVAIVSRQRASDKFDIGGKAILFHEYTHHFMLHYFPAGYPTWYVEGFAEFFSTAQFTPQGKIELGRPMLGRAPSLVQFGPVPLAELTVRGSTDGLSLVHGDRFYGTAWLFTHFLEFRPERKKQFEAYLRDTAAGKNHDEIGSYFTGGLAAVEKELRTYLERPITYRTIMLKDPVVTQVALRPMTPAENALTRFEMLSLLNRDTEGAPRFLNDLRKAAARFPQDAYAQALLSDVERVAGNTAEADAAADRAVAADANYARGLSAKAELLLERADKSNAAPDWDAARKMIIRANRADTEDPVPLKQFYRQAAMRGKGIPDVAYDGLRKAFAMVPQSPQVRLMLATALANKQEYDSAIRLLDPLANSPHDTGMRQGAAALRQAIVDAKAKGEEVSTQVWEE